MAFNKKRIEEYKIIAREMKPPANVEAMGKVEDPDGKPVITVSFACARDIVKDFYVTLAEESDTMLAIAGAVKELAEGQAVIALDLIGPKEISELLSEGEEANDQEFYAMLLMIMGLKNAIASYADFRKENKKE